MIYPSEIKTRKKIRDAKIVNDWMAGKTQKAISVELGLHEKAIAHIIRKNKDVLRLDKEFEKSKRLHYLNHALSNSKPSKKDRLDILEAHRKEIEGDKAQVETHNHFVIYRNPQAINEESRSGS